MSLTGFDPQVANFIGVLDTAGNTTAGAIWARLLPHSSGGAVLFFATKTNTYARLIKADKTARDPNYSAAPFTLGPEVSLGIAGATDGGASLNFSTDRDRFDAGRVGVDDGLDYYVIAVTTSLTPPVNQVTTITVNSKGAVTIGGTTTFPGRDFTNYYRRTTIEIRGDGATGPCLMARAAPVDGGLVVQRISLGASGVQFGTAYPHPVDEPPNAFGYVITRTLSNFVVGDDYSLLVKAAGTAYSAGYEPFLFSLDGDPEMVVIDSSTGASVGSALPSSGDIRQYLGGTRGSDVPNPGDSARSGNARQFGAKSVTEGNVIYLSRLPDPDLSTRELVGLELGPGSIVVRPTTYQLRTSSETGMRDDPPLHTSRGVMLFSSGTVNDSQYSNQAFVIDALEEFGTRRVIGGFYGFTFNSQRVRMSVEDVVEGHNCIFVMSNPADGYAYVGQVASARPVVPISGDPKDTKRLFKTPLGGG